MGPLVALKGTIAIKGVIPDSPFGSFLFLDHGSGLAKAYLNASTNIDPFAAYLKEGRKVGVTGFINQYGSGHEVQPRSKQDLVPLK